MSRSAGEVEPPACAVGPDQLVLGRQAHGGVADEVGVALGGALEGAVERLEEPVAQPVEDDRVVGGDPAHLVRGTLLGVEEVEGVGAQGRRERVVGEGQGVDAVGAHEPLVGGDVAAPDPELEEVAVDPDRLDGLVAGAQVVHEVSEAAGQVEHGAAADRQVAGHLDRGDVARLAEAREEVREDVTGDLLGGARVAELHPVLGGQRLDVGQHLGHLAAAGLAGQARPRTARERQAQAPAPREAERHGRRERQHLDQRVEAAVGLQHRDERVVVGALDLGASGDVVLHVDRPAPQDRDRVEHGVGVAVAAQDPEPPAGQGLGGGGGEGRGGPAVRAAQRAQVVVGGGGGLLRQQQRVRHRSPRWCVTATSSKRRGPYEPITDGGPARPPRRSRRPMCWPLVPASGEGARWAGSPAW